MDRLRVISLLGFGAVTLLGGVSVYWLAGRALRPLHAISRHAQQVSAGTLDQPLAVDGSINEFRELVLAFNAMLARLERGFAQQRRFVSDAAHELRTPLATLRLNLELVQANPTAALEDYQEMAATLERSLTRLERLVADLLLLATEEQALTLREVTLGPLLEEVLVDLRPLADRQQVRLRLTGEMNSCVRGNSVLLSRAFSNLIENGIRYNRPKGSVAVAIRQEGARVLISVTDTGMGIPPEEQRDIFERFYRTNRAREHGEAGTGLGLSLATHIVQQHGGEIQVESLPSIGSTFTVRLPLYTTP